MVYKLIYKNPSKVYAITHVKYFPLFDNKIAGTVIKCKIYVIMHYRTRKVFRNMFFLVMTDVCMFSIGICSFRFSH